MNSLPPRITQGNGKKIENVNIKGNEDQRVDVIVNAVFYAGATERRDAAFVCALCTFASGFRSKEVGQNNGKKCKKDCDQTERATGVNSSKLVMLNSIPIKMRLSRSKAPLLHRCV